MLVSVAMSWQLCAPCRRRIECSAPSLVPTRLRQLRRARRRSPLVARQTELGHVLRHGSCCCDLTATSRRDDWLSSTAEPWPTNKLKKWGKKRRQQNGPCAHLRASETSAEEAAAAALLRVASSLWMAAASAEGPLLPPGGGEKERKKERKRQKESRNAERKS